MASEKSHERWALIITSIASFMVTLDTLVVSVTLSTIRKDLHASVEELEWTVNMYSLCFAVFLITAAAVGDRFGRKRVFIMGLLWFIVASVICALSTTAMELILARAVQGAGAAFVLPLAMALLGAAIPAERRGKALGIFSGVTGLAVLSGPVIGGAVTEGIAWPWIFWLNVPIGLLLIPFALTRIDESYGKDTSFDTKGLFFVAVASLSLVWALIRGNAVGWLAPEIVSAVVVGVLFTILFIRWQHRAPEPMVPMKLFESSAFTFGNLAAFFLSGALFSTVFFVAQFLQIAQGHEPFAAGLRVLPWTATAFIIAPLSGALVNKTSERPLIVAGLFMQSVGLVWLASIAAPATTDIDMAIPFILAGCGVSFAIPATQSVVMNAVAKHEVGKASGIYNMIRQLGAVFGTAILVVAFSTTGSYASPQQFSNGFAIALYSSALLSLLGALAGLMVKKRLKVILSAPPQERADPEEKFFANREDANS